MFFLSLIKYHVRCLIENKNNINVKNIIMTQFMYLFRGGDAMETLSPSEMEAHMGKWKAWMGGLAEKGVLAGGLPLNKSGKQVTTGGSVVTDGPFAAGKEVIGGYLIVNAESLESAVEISKQCPLFEGEHANVEIREIMSMG